MEKAVVLTIIKLTQASLGGTDQLFPPVMYPGTDAIEERRQVLYSDDPHLRSSQIFQEVLKPKGDFDKLWIREEDVPRGVLSEYILTAVRNFQEHVVQRVTLIVDENLSRLDRILLTHAARFASQGYGYFIRKKTELFGRLPGEQADLISLLKGQDHAGARLFSYQQTDLSLDRLRGYAIFQEALATTFVDPTERLNIQKAMDKLLQQHQHEVEFWADRYVNLSMMNISLLHLAGIQYTNDYQQKTGAPRHIVDLKLEEFRNNSLYVELIASFNNDTCRRRTSGIFSRMIERALNSLGDLYADEIGAKDPRDFQIVLLEAQKQFQDLSKSLQPYEESPPFEGKAKAYEYTTAVFSNYWMLAEQIAINGGHAKNTDVNWQCELDRLHDYQRLCNHLIFVQIELLKLKCLVALNLSNRGRGNLDEKFVELAKAEYRAQQNLTFLKLSFQKSVLGILQRTNAYWEQLKGRFKDQVTRLLFTNTFLEQTPLFEDYSRMVQDHLKEDYKTIERTSSLFATVSPSLPKQMYIEKGEVITPTSRISVRTSGGSPKGSKLNDSVLLPKSPESINLNALSIHKRFIDVTGYIEFVNNPTFLELITIKSAIEFCIQNHEEKKEGWDWIREKNDLTVLKRLMEGIQAYSASGRYIPAQSSSTSYLSVAASILWTQKNLMSAQQLQNKGRSPEIIKQELLSAFHKKITTDNSQKQRELANKAGFQAQAYLNFSLAYQSLRRKYERKNISNMAPDFRDQAYIYNLELELGLRKLQEIPDEEMQKMIKEFEDSSEGPPASRTASVPIVGSSLAASSALKPAVNAVASDSLPPRLDDSEPPPSPASRPSSPGSQPQTEVAGTQSGYWGLSSLSRFTPSIPSLQSLPFSFSLRKPSESLPPVAPVSPEKEGVPKSPSGDLSEDKKK